MVSAVRIVVIAALVVFAAVVDAVLFGPLHLPGAAPNLLLLVVASWALVIGPVRGAFTGFFAGLLIDVVPPSDHLIGRYALALCVAGYLAGLLREEARDSVAVALLAVTLAVAVATVLYAVMGVMLADSRMSVRALASSVPFAIGYDVLLAPFVAPWVMALARRTQRKVVRA